ncbi:hypothetical protein GW537_08430 [Piscirickettsia salmonis]|uniref:hypothetical protein n=1 Tax=Piscirickettsia salmonis TaxID=1238 RepID=UPI00094A6028|nr:hypothetical protein [Piscirickettsia salmonis]APS70915.1 hypothetical protein AVI56_11800 [Piscirickettsia salmonis]QGO84062.1 hypothetical protein Psal108_01651 [Piscirickettsia salmonis]QHS29131.1 hypothetical protein GW537_08430 [Piscirickettsia salmonis]
MSENDNDKHNYHNTINCDLKDIINKNINEISPSKIAELQYLQKLYENKKILPREQKVTVKLLISTSKKNTMNSKKLKKK